MEDIVLQKVVNYFGSITEVAKKLGLKRQHVSGWLNGRTEIALEYALQIEKLMQGEVQWQELVPPQTLHRMQRLSWLHASDPIELFNVLIKRVCLTNIEQRFMYFRYDQKNSLSFEALRPIIIDHDHHLIFGRQTLLAYQQRGKKTVPAWRLSLAFLLQNKYHAEELSKTFLISERVLIGLALEEYLGDRRKRKEVENFPPLKGVKTRDVVARCLGFGNHKTYEQAKRIMMAGSSELIQHVDQKHIAISSALYLAQLPLKKQRTLLVQDRKSVLRTIRQLKKDKHAASSLSYVSLLYKGSHALSND